MAANEPHAYLQGECVECMALSDNVVRAGLTPKFRDVDTLCSMLTYNMYRGEEVFTDPEQISKSSVLYKAAVEEFAVVRTEFKGADEHESIQRDSETVLLCLSGNVELSFQHESRPYGAGSILILPAGEKIGLACKSAEGALLFQAFKP